MFLFICILSHGVKETSDMLFAVSFATDELLELQDFVSGEKSFLTTLSEHMASDLEFLV